MSDVLTVAEVSCPECAAAPQGPCLDRSGEVVAHGHQARRDAAVARRAAPVDAVLEPLSGADPAVPEWPALAIGPRRVGGRYRCGYWAAEYRVLRLRVAVCPPHARPAGLCGEWEITVAWADGHETTHCTPWDEGRDRVLSQPGEADAAPGAEAVPVVLGAEPADDVDDGVVYVDIDDMFADLAEGSTRRGFTRQELREKAPVGGDRLWGRIRVAASGWVVCLLLAGAGAAVWAVAR